MSRTSGKGPLHRLHALLAALGVTLVAVLALELAARLALFLNDHLLHLGRIEAAARAPAAAGLDYDLESLLEEQESLPHPSYQPYTVWHSRPYRGTYFHVDDRGHRVTPCSSDDPGALRIWMLGGSTVFGYGAPDDQTIPCHLALRLSEKTGVPVRVENLGQGGYVSTQEVVELLRESQLRDPPPVVIFYDGYNDAVAIKSWPQAPGSHFQLDRIRSRFEGSFAPLIQSSTLFRLIEPVVRTIEPATPQPSAQQTRELGEHAAELWLRNTALAKGLGRALGFHTLFFLQPARGHRVLDAMEQAVTRKLSRRTEGEGPDIYDLTDTFRGHEDEYFLDTVHLTGPGNLRIARRIADVLLQGICSDPSLRDRFATSSPCVDG